VSLRLFLALNFDAEARARWYAAAEPLRALAAEGIRWTPPAQLHLTLAFLGDQPETIVEPLSTAVGVVARSQPALDLTVDGVGAFPTWRKARVIWLGLAPASELTALATQVVAACHALGLPGFDRPFHPHVTLGRIGDRVPQRLVRAIADVAPGIASDATARTSSIDLMASALSTTGARHEVLHTAPLRGERVERRTSGRE